MIRAIYKDIKIERLNTFAIFAVVFLIAIYLFIANNIATANYQRTVLLKNIDELRAEIRTLNLELADKRNLSFLKKASQDFNLVVNDSIQYIKITGPVAKNP